MSNRAKAIVGFGVAGLVLVALADVAPDAALGLTAVIGLGVLLSHASQLQQLTNGFIIATGHTPPQNS